MSHSLWPLDYIVHGILYTIVQERASFPVSRGYSQPWDQTQVSHITGGFFTSWATREALIKSSIQVISLLSRRRQRHPTPVLLPGKSHGWRSLVGCSPWGCEESDLTERLHFHFSLLCTGEGNGNPLQCSCLENPKDGVAQSQTRLKWLSSSSSSLLSSSSKVHVWINFPSSYQ